MASCEKCWNDSYLMARLSPSKSREEIYHDLIKVRNCTPEEQAGDEAKVCPECKRKTIHQYAKVCMNTDCKNFNRKE